MKTCPQCHAVGNDTDNFCGKCGYIYNQEISLQRNMDQEYSKAIKKSKTYYRFTKFLLIILILILLIFMGGMSFDQWFCIPIYLLFLFSVYQYFYYVINSFYSHEKKINSFYSHEKKIKRYHPEKKFRYYLKLTEQRKRPYKLKRNFCWILTAGTVVYCILSLILRPNPYPFELCLEIVMSILLIVFLIYFASINQAKFLGIKYHQTIDDATYFELEELGLIKDTDVVISLYKDFTSWKDIKSNSKILILTQDALMCLVFSDRTHAKKVTATLNSIDELSILKSFIFVSITKANPNGMIITIGQQKKYLRVMLKGSSIQDSPEEFVTRFLKQLDNTLLTRPHDEVKTYRRTESTTSENLEQIRLIEIADLEPPLQDRAVASVSSNQPSRTIDL